MKKTYLLLLRGINVGGKNTLPMAELRKFLEKMDYTNVRTYIASGNLILDSDKTQNQIKTQVEQELIKNFKLDSKLIKVLVLTPLQLQSIVKHKPKGFGEQPQKYYSDAVFLIDIDVKEALQVFNPREEVDTIWPGKNVIYSQRLAAERTKSRLNKVMGTQAYQSMTIRSWNTVMKLLDLLSA